MDSGTAILVTILRIAHIFSAVLWVGAGFLMSMYFEPVIVAVGGDARKFMRALYTKTAFDKMMPVVSLTTTVAGVILYLILASGTDFARSSQGIVLGIGALAGLGAFGHGAGVLGRKSGVYQTKIKEAGDNPSAEQNKELSDLEDFLLKHARISMWMTIVAVVFMAGARYVPAILGR